VSNLQLRLASTAVLLPTIIACFAAGGWWARGLALVAAGASFFEFGAVVAKGDWLARLLLLVMGLFVTWAGIVTTDALVFIMAIQLAFVLLASLFVLRPGADLQVAFRSMGLLVFSLLWITPGMISLGRLRDLGDTVVERSASLGTSYPAAAAACFLLVAMVGTWSNDTTAYFAGRFLGKHKMAGAISPKKTWEGFVGGMFGPPVFLFAGRAIFPDTFAPLSTTDIIILSIPMTFLGPIGDMCESLWKRAYDVKDSGNLIPGHGGMLDRVDAVFFVAPWVLAYFVIVKPMLLG
jgi:phosphatidate cytidylyltransferase